MKVAFPVLFRFRKPVVSLYLDYYLRPLQRIVCLYFCYHTCICKEHRYIGAFLPYDPIVIRVFTAKPGLDFFPPQGKLFITEAHMQWKGEERVRTLLSFHSLCGQLKCETQGPGSVFAWNQCEERGKEHVKSFIASPCLNSIGPVWKEGDSLLPEKAHHKFFPI